MFLDIIIPQYAEDEILIKKALDSIGDQLGVDFSEIGIIIINDCSNKIISDSFLANYTKLNITYLKNEKNMGAGLSRQRGIDYSNAKYITFLDADDYFYGNAGLQLVIACLKETNADLVQTSFIGERKGEDGLYQVKFEADYNKAWLHAKYIKRDFLIKHNITFSSALSNNFEDSYFCSLINGFDFNKKKCININYPTYYWCYNKESITRKEGKHHYYVDAFDDYMLCPELVYDRLKSHNKYFADIYLRQAICNIYIILMSKIFDGKDLIERKNNYRQKFIDLVKSHIDCFKKTTKKSFRETYKEKLKALEINLGIEINIEDIDCFFIANNIYF